MLLTRRSGNDQHDQHHHQCRKRLTMLQDSLRKTHPAFVSVLVCLVCLQLSEALIVPQEFPTILSLVYSNIPPVKKGTDSRLGFGFRLGEHADFQILLELGPQKETRPIGDQSSMDDSSFSKRQVSRNQQRLVKQQPPTTERTAASWLESWSKEANAGRKKASNKYWPALKKQNTRKDPTMPQVPVIPEQTLKQLQLLYKMASTTEVSPAAATTQTTSTTSLTSNVNHVYLEKLLNLTPPTQNPEDLQAAINRQHRTKSQITEELMNVSLDE